jgi:RNA polymerase sigma-70 factor (ECF subfamily)
MSDRTQFVQRRSEALADEKLIIAIATGDRNAMSVLYARHYQRVLHFVSRFCEATDAEDVVSEVFADVWNQAARFEGRSRVSTWIFAIARFKALTLLQRRRETELDDATVRSIEDTANTPEEAILSQERSQQINACIFEMSREHRDVISLFYLREKSIDEVAKITRTPKNTVKTRMYYARKRLVGLLSQYEDFEGHAPAQLKALSYQKTPRRRCPRHAIGLAGLQIDDDALSSRQHGTDLRTGARATGSTPPFENSCVDRSGLRDVIGLACRPRGNHRWARYRTDAARPHRIVTEITLDAVMGADRTVGDRVRT